MDLPFVAENARERERLKSLVGRLTDKELSIRLGDDWTIAAALAHLAFWDQRALVMLRKWKKSGVVEPSAIDIDVTNDSLLSTWLALPSRTAANLALSSAEEIDRELEQASSDLITRIESLGERFRLYRSIHRKLHVDEIENVLKGKTGA
jgi:hypothetical protein